MKKKLIQLLMLAFVAVSIGAFVSCKDTNEDLYNQLRAEANGSYGTLQDRYNALQQALNNHLADYQALLAQVNGINSCNCSDPSSWTSGQINNLQQQINNLQTQLSAMTQNLGDLSTLVDPITGEPTNVNDLINSLTTQINNLTNELTTLTNNYTTLASVPGDLENLQNTLNNEIANLQSQIDALQGGGQGCSCGDLLERVTTLETKMATAEANITEAFNKITEAKNAADAATTLANAATQAAADAAQAAATAEQKAIAAGATADEAKAAAETAKQNAETALNTANDAIAMATTLQTLVNTNTTNIANLQTDVQTINNTLTQYGTQISDNAAAIQENTNKIAENVTKIQENANAIAELQTKVANMQTELSTVSQTASDAFSKANDAYAKATANEASISALNDRVTANETDIQNLQTTVSNLTTTVNDLTTQVNTNTDDIATLKTKVENLNTAVTTLNTTVNNLTTKVSELSDKLDTLEADLAQAKADCAANLEAAKAYTDQEIAALKTELLTEIATQLANYYTKTEIDAQQDAQDIKINANTTKIGELETTVNDHTTAIETINEALAAIKSCTCDPEVINNIIERLTEAEKNIGDNADAIAANTELINSVKEELTKLINDQIDAMKTELEDKINTVDGKVDALQLVVDNLNYITPEEVEDLLNALQDQVDAELAALKQTDEDYKKRMDIIGDSVKTAFADIVDLTARVQVLESTTVNINDYNADKEAILNRISTNETNISDLQDRVTTLEGEITTLKEDLNTLKGRMDAAEGRLDDAEKAIDELKEDVAAIQNYLAKMITGITIQGTINPWFGSISTPFDVQTNILITFYGRPKTDVEFPTMKTANYVNADDALTEKDMEMINGVEIFEKTANTTLLYDNGYAGKIYMTINPNTADVSGLQPVIVNSKDVESPFTLEPIKVCTEDALQFGWTSPTRAQSSNGLYVAKVGVKATDVPRISEPRFETNEMKDALANAKEALTTLAKTHSTSGTGSNLAKIASDVLAIVKGLRFDRSGLKVSYTTTDENGAETEHSVYSEYNLAATGFQPLGFETLKDLNVKTIPGYERVNNLLDRIANKLKNEIIITFQDFNGSNLVQKVAVFRINDINLSDLSGEDPATFILNIDENVTIDGLKYHLVVPIDPIPVTISTDVDLTGVSFEIPTLVVSADGGGSTLVVPVEDTPGHQIGVASIDLSDIKVDPTNNTITLNGQTVHITGSTTIDPDDIDQWINFGEQTFKLKMSINVKDFAENILGVAEDRIMDKLDEAQVIVDEVNNLIAKINSYEGKLTSTIDSYIDRIKDYLDDINRMATSLINSTNSRFQPFMVASTSKGLKRLSGAKNYPTNLGKDITLYPTSQTFELFVPMARKHVAVTNVFSADLSKSAQDGDSDCKSKLTAANTGKLNTVVDGTVREMKLSGLVSGYVYEIAYSALDFHGKIATRKYYVTVE